MSLKVYVWRVEAYSRGQGRLQLTPMSKTTMLNLETLIPIGTAETVEATVTEET